MKLTILGTGNHFPDKPVGSAGYVLEHGDTTLKLDFGRANLMNMALAGIDWKKLDAILLSHVHPDHICDLVQYLQAYTLIHIDEIVADYNVNDSRTKDVTIYGPRGFSAYFEHLRKVVITQWAVIPEVKEIYDDNWLIGDIEITAAPVKHFTDSAGFRFTAENKVFCYTGDAGISPELVELAEEADVLLTECSMQSGKEGNSHMSPVLVAELANKAQVKKVALTHWPADNEIRQQRVQEVQSQFGGEVISAEDLMVIEI